MSKTRVAVIGAGISGLVAATALTRSGAVEVVLYEKEDYLGGDAKSTVTHDVVYLDLSFMFFNRVSTLYNGGCTNFPIIKSQDVVHDDMWCDNGIVTYPNLMEFFQSLGVEMEESDMSFSVSIDRGHGYEWGSRNGISSLFAQKKNVLNPYFWQMIREIAKFKDDALMYLEDLEDNPDISRNETLGHFIESRGCLITCQDGSQETYDGCIVATNAPDTLKMLGKQATCDETRVLGAFQYVYSDIFLHRDKNFMPQNLAAWSGWNFLTTADDKVCLTYWLNVLQNIRDTELPYLVTINPPHPPEHNLLKWSSGHPIPSIAASKASIELDHIQGKRGIWFAGAYRGYGFQEDGVKASLVAANSILTKSCAVLSIPKHMLPSFMETGARIFVISLLEEGGSTITFEGTGKKCLLKTSLRVHSPQFYWKVEVFWQVATRRELGLADAYIHGDFSLVDENEGLQNLFMNFIANRDLKTSVSIKRGWRTPLLFTACIGSAKYFFQHVSGQNALTQARRNISRHYDLSNELFALFLDETLTYSCAIFEARINEEHEIFEIGSGWGSLAIEVVKRTRCNYTGITLSEEQLRFAEMKVKEAGLQDRIKFLLCHYRQLPDTCKYDRIISCEMIEHVGHEYMEEFFGCCDSQLADHGLLVLQFTSIPDERYDQYRGSSEFIKEYIFPGACIPSLSRITSAMAASSRLW
ncbi:hypothetical protein RHGRI_011914 [Rhododendron griersonianum]|uniref:Cyclopropane-fatty-acyl-phospholipid synthase n=1 Tax=Rhododendron griersonianum TaxID=479676 RepID=A0AAV6KNK8_9ERIC|nr:hypothetical protein RHGRI_011914 [Rhododendron griersonianum]